MGVVYQQETLSLRIDVLKRHKTATAQFLMEANPYIKEHELKLISIKNKVTEPKDGASFQDHHKKKHHKVTSTKTRGIHNNTRSQLIYLSRNQQKLHSYFYNVILSGKEVGTASLLQQHGSSRVDQEHHAQRSSHLFVWSFCTKHLYSVQCHSAGVSGARGFPKKIRIIQLWHARQLTASLLLEGDLVP